MPYKTNFEPLKQTFKTLSANSKLKEAYLKQNVLQSWSRVIKDFFQEAEKLTKAVDFKKGVLVVACLDKKLAYEIQVLAARIIFAINSVLGTGLVSYIQVEH